MAWLTSLRSPIALLVLALLMQGCSLARVDDNLPYGVLDNNDMTLVGQGLPTYLLFVDGLLQTWPDDVGLLRTDASLYSAYASLYVQDPARSRKLMNKAMGYAFKAACLHDDDLCHLRHMPVPAFEKKLADMDKGDVPVLYTLGSTWAGYIQANSSDLNAIADLARVRGIMERVVALNPGYEFGQAHMYLGVLDSLLPASLGGRPQEAKTHFEKAIQLSHGKNLLAKVLYAKQYARMVFDRDLYDRLLKEVLAADPNAHGLTLQNVYAQKQAAKLEAEADDYFD